MARSERHLKIIDLVTKSDINTQEELVKRLKSAGFDVTQATVSRDIKELGLVKVMTEDRRYKYSYVRTEPTQASGMMFSLFKETVLTFEAAQNIIVIKCISGGASTAAALIDKLKISEIAGTVAGDDTVLVVVSTLSAVKSVMARLRQIMEQ